VGQGLLIYEVSRLRTQRHTTVGRTPLEGRLTHRRDLYLTTHNTHIRQISLSLWRDWNPQSQQARNSRSTP